MSMPLLHSPADLVRRLLIAQGMGLLPPTTPWPIFATNEPAKPDNCVTVYDTAGMSDGRSMIDGELWQHYGIQIRTRAATFPLGWQKTAAIRKACSEDTLDETVIVEGASYVIHAITHIGMIIPLGNEVADGQVVSSRQIFTLNATVSLQRVQAGTGS